MRRWEASASLEFSDRPPPSENALFALTGKRFRSFPSAWPEPSHATGPARLASSPPHSSPAARTPRVPRPPRPPLRGIPRRLRRSCRTVLQDPRCQNCHPAADHPAPDGPEPGSRDERPARPRWPRPARRALRDLPREGQSSR
jgi:hypothetical protein